MEELKPKPKRQYPWLRRFWDEHGDRLFFAAIALAMALTYPMWIYIIKTKLSMEVPGEVNAVYWGIAMLCFNKARGGKNGKG